MDSRYIALLIYKAVLDMKAEARSIYPHWGIFKDQYGTYGQFTKKRVEQLFRVHFIKQSRSEYVS